MLAEPIEANYKEFQQTLRDYIKKSRKETARALNEKLGDVAMRAIKTTYSTNTAKIMSELERVVDVGPKYVIKRGLKAEGGTFRRRIKTKLRKSQAQSYVGTYKLVNWLLRRQGFSPLGNSKIGGPGSAGMGNKTGTIGQLARKLVAGRKRSVNFIRNGWAAAAMAFGKRPSVFSRGDYSDAALKRLGGGEPADDKNLVMEGMIFNRAGSRDIRYNPPLVVPMVGKGRKPISGALAIGKPGLAQAVNDVVKDMAIYIAGLHKKAWSGK